MPAEGQSFSSHSLELNMSDASMFQVTPTAKISNLVLNMRIKCSYCSNPDVHCPALELTLESAHMSLPLMIRTPSHGVAVLHNVLVLQSVLASIIMFGVWHSLKSALTRYK